MTELLATACSLGVGGFLGLIIFLMYRQDRKSSEERINRIAEQDQVIISRDQITREANTKALTELIVLLERMNGRK